MPNVTARGADESVFAGISAGALSADGPEFLIVDPTTIGVGVTRGKGFALAFMAGMEFETTTLTGVGVGSIPD
jgi:hypothetical protein